MTAQPQQLFTVDEYLERERVSDLRHEYHDGKIVAQAGGSESHSLIIVNVGASLHTQLRKTSCAVHSSDLRVRIESANAYVYPDVTVVCGDAHFIDERRDTLLNPTVIIEVISPSTQKYDRGYKAQKYRTIPSLQEYLIIEQQSPYVEHYLRKSEFQWLLNVANQLDHVIELVSLNCTLLLSDIYERVTFSSLSDDD